MLARFVRPAFSLSLSRSLQTAIVEDLQEDSQRDRTLGYYSAAAYYRALAHCYITKVGKTIQLSGGIVSIVPPLGHH